METYVCYHHVCAMESSLLSCRQFLNLRQKAHHAVGPKEMHPTLFNFLFTEGRYRSEPAGGGELVIGLTIPLSKGR